MQAASGFLSDHCHPHVKRFAFGTGKITIKITIMMEGDATCAVHVGGMLELGNGMLPASRGKTDILWKRRTSHFD